MATPLHELTQWAWRRRAPGSGSHLWRLLEAPRVSELWWREAHRAFGSIPHVIVGAVAANQYMPPRTTSDIDFAIALGDEARALDALRDAGWKLIGPLQTRAPIRGTGWTRDGHDIDVLYIPQAWSDMLVTQDEYASLAWLVVLKLTAGRTKDAGDLTRMLGHQPDDVINCVRTLVEQILPYELGDLDQLIALGRLEYGVT